MINSTILLFKLLLAALTLLASARAAASEYGCTVALCLANPDGPRAVEECRPPIDRLFRDLRRGRPFPRCDHAGASNTQGTPPRAEAALSYYDPCPVGTATLGAGLVAVAPAASTLYTGIGDGEAPNAEGGAPARPKVCVGRHIGLAPFSTSDGVVSVDMYDTIVALEPYASPRAIDVYLDAHLLRRVRY